MVDVLSKLDEAENRIDEKLAEKLESIDDIELSEQEVDDLKDELDVEIDIQEEINEQVVKAETDLFQDIENVVIEKEIEDYENEAKNEGMMEKVEKV